jgi:nucleoid-associated protein YgaU
MNVTLEEYSIIEDAANGFDLTIPVRLKQYRQYSALEYNPLLPDKAKGATNTNSNKTKTYTVKKGDTLWGICKKYLGDGSKYPQIAKLNGIKNPNLIMIGQVIKLG